MLHLIILQRSPMFRRMLILQHSTHTGVRVTAEGLKHRAANTLERTGTDLSRPQGTVAQCQITFHENWVGWLVFL